MESRRDRHYKRRSSGKACRSRRVRFEDSSHMGTCPVNPFVTMVIMIKDMIIMVKITVFGYKKPRSPSPHLSKWEGREKRQRSIVKNFAP